jgi:hypothetical protein
MWNAGLTCLPSWFVLIVAQRIMNVRNAKRISALIAIRMMRLICVKAESSYKDGVEKVFIDG